MQKNQRGQEPFFFNQIAELFVRDKSVISRHLRNIYKTRELTKKATVTKNATVQTEGGREEVELLQKMQQLSLTVKYIKKNQRGQERMAVA